MSDDYIPEEETDEFDEPEDEASSQPVDVVSEATELLGMASRVHLESEWVRITEEPVIPNLNAVFLMALVLSNVVSRLEALEAKNE